jgi:hypothetical protein
VDKLRGCVDAIIIFNLANFTLNVFANDLIVAFQYPLKTTFFVVIKQTYGLNAEER